MDEEVAEQMFDSVLKLIGASASTTNEDKSSGKVTVAATALLDRAISQYWTTNSWVVKDYPAEFVPKRAERFRQQGLTILASGDPMQANRVALADAIVALSQTDILTKDCRDTGELNLREYGISGELKPRLFDLWMCDDGFKKMISKIRTREPRNWDDVWNPVLFEYRHAWAQVKIFNALRGAVGDYEPGEPDWLLQVVTNNSAFWEDRFRTSLGLPRLLDNDQFRSTMIALSLCSLLHRVFEGHAKPAEIWLQSLRETEIGIAALAKAAPFMKGITAK